MSGVAPLRTAQMPSITIEPDAGESPVASTSNERMRVGLVVDEEEEDDILTKAKKEERRIKRMR